MARPLKKVNLDDLPTAINQTVAGGKYEEIEVRFSPLSTDEFVINGNRLIINFFSVRPDEAKPDKGYIGELDLRQYIKSKIVELLSN